MRVDRSLFSVRRWPGVRSEYSWLPPDGGVTVTKPYQVGVSFSEHARVGYETGGRARYISVPAGAVFANGPQEVLWSDVGEPTEALEIYPDPALLHAAVEPSRSGALEIDLATAARDATVLGIAAVLKRAHVHSVDLGIDLDDMQASTLAHRLAAHLADHYCRPRRRYTAGRPPRPGRLDRPLVDRVAQLVEERLGEPILLDDLAREARLSPYHFARAFKNSTGMAPHEFVTMRRLERAKTLLLGTRRSVPEIAYEVGYFNVSHFRRILRRYTGFAPSDLRPT